jgi:hypothetical protein
MPKDGTLGAVTTVLESLWGGTRLHAVVVTTAFLFADIVGRYPNDFEYRKYV